MNILVGISGSIAAYKSPLLVRALQARGASVRVVMTPSATQFIPALTLQNLTKAVVPVEMFDESVQTGGSWHIHLARWCDGMVIAPCSASTLGKLANGIADTALVNVAIALTAPQRLVLAPAMDTEMWLHPATQRNCATLRRDGAVVIPPAEGELASGFQGVGRLPDITFLVETILQEIQPNAAPTTHNAAGETTARHQDAQHRTAHDPFQEYQEYSNRFESYARQLDPTAHSSKAASGNIASENTFSINPSLERPVVTVADAAEAGRFDAELELTKLKQSHGGSTTPFPLAGKMLLITAGPTFEKIDDVRFIGNYSSGQMGFALAEIASQMGAKSVQLVSGPVGLATPHGVERIDVESAREMFDVVMNRRANADVIILSAAVADFTPAEKHDGKLKKEHVGETMTLRLTKTPDILAAVGAVKHDAQIVVGFALEASNHLENAKAKLMNKRADMIVLNALGGTAGGKKEHSGFGTSENTITLVEADAVQEFPPLTKKECARRILLRIAERLPS